jgi:hypothetical protein
LNRFATLELFTEVLALVFIVFQRPGARDFEPVIVLGGAVAELGLQVLLDPAVEFHGGPMALSSHLGVFDAWQDFLTHLFLGQDATASAAATGNEVVETGEVERSDEAQHMAHTEA